MRLLIVKRTSMYPTIIPDDKVLIVKSNDFNRGDFIVYKEKKNLIVHRLLKKRKDYFITKGDNNICSEKIFVNKVIGKVVFINKTKYSNNLLQKIIAFFSLFQSKISFLCCENNSVLRKSFKVFSNPALYIVNSLKITRK